MQLGLDLRLSCLVPDLVLQILTHIYCSADCVLQSVCIASNPPSSSPLSHSPHSLTHSLYPNPSLPPSHTFSFFSPHEILQYATKLPETHPLSPIVRDPEPFFLKPSAPFFFFGYLIPQHKNRREPLSADAAVSSPPSSLHHTGSLIQLYFPFFSTCPLPSFFPA